MLFIETLEIRRGTYKKAVMIGALGVEEVQGLPASHPALTTPEPGERKGPVRALPPDLAVRCAALQRCWKFQAMLASDHQAKNQGSCFARVFQMYFALSRVGI